MNETFSEKRKYIRYEIDSQNISIKMLHSGGIVPCRIQNISKGGICILITGLSACLINNSHVSLSFQVDNKKYTLNSRVVYSYKHNSFQTQVYGFEFLHHNKEDIIKILKSCID